MLIAGLCAGIGQIAMTLSFRDLPVGEGSLMQMLTPLGVAIGSVLFYQEHFSLFESVGAVLILGGTMIPAIRQQVRLRES